MRENLDQLFQRFSQMHVLVIGDIMLDTYWWGHVERISPEAPVPVVQVDKKEERVGGAGNVALNAAALGAQVSMITVMGADEDAAQLETLLQNSNINPKFMVKSHDRATTNKIRIISRNQHMMRLDREQTQDISTEDEDKLLYAFENCIASQNPEVVILEDYNKGVLTQRIIQEVISLCNKRNIITAVDPKRKNFFAYKQATIFKPNLKEVKEGLNLLADSLDLAALKEIHSRLHEQLNHEISLITLSEKGMFYQIGENSVLIPSHRREIADVSGAGDTVVSVAAMVYAASRDIELAAELANIAGGLVCEEVGTIPINKEKFYEECRQLLGNK